MILDELDIKVLKENFDEETIEKLEPENAYKIFEYLSKNGIYYIKDLFLSSFDLFLLPAEEFIRHFEILKSRLGSNYVELLGKDSSYIEIMYEQYNH